MAITYKKNAQNVYKVPFYVQFWTWWALVLALAVLSLLLGLVVVSIKLVQVALWSLVAILTIWRAYSLTKSVIKAKTIGKYITQKKAEKAVTKSLLATMSVNRLQDTPYISVPSVTVCDSRPSHISVEVEKLAGMYDVDKLTEDINSSFRGKLGAYAVTSAMIKCIEEEGTGNREFVCARETTLKQLHALDVEEAELFFTYFIDAYGKNLDELTGEEQ